MPIRERRSATLGLALAAVLFLLPLLLVRAGPVPLEDEALLPPATLPIDRTPAPELEDFGGDAAAWLRELSVWSLSQWQDSRKAEICRRAASVLEHMAELQGAPV